MTIQTDNATLTSDEKAALGVEDAQVVFTSDGVVVSRIDSPVGLFYRVSGGHLHGQLLVTANGNAGVFYTRSSERADVLICDVEGRESANTIEHDDFTTLAKNLEKAAQLAQHASYRFSHTNLLSVLPASLGVSLAMVILTHEHKMPLADAELAASLVSSGWHGTLSSLADTAASLRPKEGTDADLGLVAGQQEHCLPECYGPAEDGEQCDGLCDFCGTEQATTVGDWHECDACSMGEWLEEEL